jgi:hypothetical protein
MTRQVFFAYVIAFFFNLLVAMAGFGLAITLLSGCSSPNAQRLRADYYFVQPDFVCADGRVSKRCSLSDGRAL